MQKQNTAAGAALVLAGVALGALLVSSTSQPPLMTPAGAQAPASSLTPLERVQQRQAASAAREAALRALRPSKVFAIVRRSDGQVEEYRRAETPAEALEAFVFPWKRVSDARLLQLQGAPGFEMRADGAVRVTAFEEEHYLRADYEAIDTTWDGKERAPVPATTPGFKRVFNTTTRQFEEVPE